MGKTAAERQRERRLRLKQDPREYEKYKKRDRERKDAEKKNLSPAALRKLKERTRLAVRKHRAAQTEDEASALDSPSDNQQIGYKYGNKAALHKAKSRVMKALPKSPRKRVTILKVLASEVLDVHVVNQPRRRLLQETLDAVIAFYQEDTVSRLMPGKADCVTIRDSNGEKVKKQKRHLVMTLSEAYSCFKADNPESSIGKSKFAELRPKWVFLSSEMPHNVCGCRYHENVFLLLEALHRKYPDVVPLYSKELFTSRCVCNIDSEECMSNNCKTCADAKLFTENFLLVVGEDPTFRWYQWVEENGFLQKSVKEGSTTDAFNDLARQLPKFFWHSFIKEKQAASYTQSKSQAMEPDSKSCLLQMDFAENYTCLWQDEIQSAHWKQRQITVYTVMVYHRGQILSYVIVSDYREHEKYAVVAFTGHMLEVIKSEMPHVEVVDVWTDGPSSQYKNKYVFALLHSLQDTSGLQIHWNYFATSHGKGPNDALGGNIKRMAHRVVMGRSSIITNAESFATAVRACNTTVRLHVMNEDAIKQKCLNLGVEDLWNGLQTFQGTITTHSLKPLDKDTIQLKFYSSATEYRNVTARRNMASDFALNATTSAHAQPVTSTTVTSTTTMSNTAHVHINAEPRPTTPSKSIPNATQQADNVQRSTAKRDVNVCRYCGHEYGDISDPKLKEDWIVCCICGMWVHESCGEDYGVIDDGDRYTCAPCM